MAGVRRARAGDSRASRQSASSWWPGGRGGNVAVGLMPSARVLILGCTFVAVGAWFVSLWTRATGGIVAFDLYQYWLPNMRHGLQRIGAGGDGLLWNPFQNCGQPSFAISSTGLLYPLNVLFFGLDSDLTIRVQV